MYLARVLTEKKSRGSGRESIGVKEIYGAVRTIREFFRGEEGIKFSREREREKKKMLGTR